jgi:AIPR protein
MQQPPLVRDTRVRPDSPEVVDFPFYSVRNVSCPEDLENGRKILFGSALATAVLDLDTDQNVRAYLMEAKGRQRRRPTQVLRAIRETLDNNPQNFSVLNGGVTIVAHDYEINEKKKTMRLLNPSIINGSQTQGVLRDYYRDMEESGDTPPPIHVTFELIVTDDEKLIADTSIARNFQEDVMTISIAGRLGQLEDLEYAVQRVYPEYKLRMSETQLSDDYIVTERLIQVMTALTPPELWMGKTAEDGSPIKTYTYSAKTKCLRDFQEVFKRAKDTEDPDHEKYNRLYRFYLDIAPQAYELHEKWKRHQGFIGPRVYAVKRDETGKKVVDVPDGLVFPIFAALSAFAEKKSGEWRLVEPPSFTDKELIDTAVSVYRTVANSDPQKMGKSHASYFHLYQLTSLHKRLSK